MSQSKRKVPFSRAGVWSLPLERLSHHSRREGVPVKLDGLHRYLPPPLGCRETGTRRRVELGRTRSSLPLPWKDPLKLSILVIYSSYYHINLRETDVQVFTGSSTGTCGVCALGEVAPH